MKFSRKKLVLSMALLGLTSMVSVNVYAQKGGGGSGGATTTTTTTAEVNYIAAISPVAGTATVDGNISEWNTGAGSPDFSAKMCTAGSVGANGDCEGSGKVHLSTMYSRYDCNADTMYILVLETAGNQAILSDDDAWVTNGGKSSKVVNGSAGDNGTPPDFQWVTVDRDLKGYEASFPLSAGSHSPVEVHLQVTEGATGKANTSSTGKINDSATITVPATCTMPSTETPATSGSTETPATSGSTETPATSGSTETPATSGSTETPATSGSTETPATSGSTETPATSGNTETTADCSGTDGADAPTSTTVSWADDKGTNSYDFVVTREGNTWTYQVDKAGGKDLSHWTLIVPNCVAKVSDATNGVETGQDGSIKDRSVSGIKWNSEGGTFSFTLDGDYAVSTVEVLAKAGNGYSTSMIMGPDCSMLVSNKCPPPPTEYVTSIVGGFYDDNICNLMNKDAKKIIGKNHLTTGWIVEQWVPMDGYLDTLNSVGEIAGSGLPVSLSGDENVKICPAGVMKGGCNEGNAVDTQAFTTGENGKVDFAVLVKWPGVPDAVLVPAYEVIRYGQDGIKELVKKGSFIDGTPVRANYNITAIAGKTGVEIIGGLEKGLLWNPGMSEAGCTLTLKKRNNK